MGWLRELRTISSWNRSQASQASASSLKTVLIDTSATRLIDRIDDPSQSIERIWTRLARGSFFMPRLYERPCFSSSTFVQNKTDSIGRDGSANARVSEARLQRPSIVRG